jgi:H+/Cl- antiporter ClcA
MGELKAQTQSLESLLTDQMYQVFATVVAAMASFTALLYIFILLMAHQHATTLLWAWDLILFILWVAVFGIFGGMYIKATSTYDSGIKRMKAAVWVDLVNMLLWLVSGAGSVYVFFSQRGKLGLHSTYRTKPEDR